MNEITSLNNELIKSVSKLSQKKYRDETGLFLLEGEKCVEEGISFGLKINNIFINKNNTKLVEKYSQYPTTLVNTKILEKITDTKTAPDIVATSKKLENKLENIPKKNSAILFLENIKDAGNLGTAIRTASAFNIDGIILFGDTVDLYSPKVVRSSVGYLWKTPVYKTNDFEEIKNYFSEHKFFATSVNKALNLIPIKDAQMKPPCVIMFGSEAFGLSEKSMNFSDFYVTIPIKGDIESLNLSISIGIVLYEFKR